MKMKPMLMNVLDSPSASHWADCRDAERQEKLKCRDRAPRAAGWVVMAGQAGPVVGGRLI